MRGISIRDVNKAARFIKISGLKEEAKSLFDAINNGREFEMSNEAGFDLIMSLILRCENENVLHAFCDFVAGPLEIDAAEAYDMDIMELSDMIIKWANTVSKERWKGFFTLLIKMIKEA